MVKEKEYEGLKQLLDNLKIGIVKKATDRGYSTLLHIKKSTSFEDFRRLVKEAYMPYMHKKVEPDLSKTAMENRQETASQNDATILGVLERIATSLEKLETHWRPEKKKGLFS